MNQIILLSLLSIVYSETDVKEYLLKYGYIEESAITDDVSSGLIKFQEFFDLPADGELNQQTLNLMNTPRCGVKDDPTHFRIHPNKWNKTNLKWYFSLANIQQRQVAQQAFDDWQGVSRLTFEYNQIKPDILISFSNRPTQHNNNVRCMNGTCSDYFDGQGQILAHAFFPTGRDTCRELHLDKSENWYLGFDDPPSDQTSLYTVLLHEIGHTLGIQYSGVESALMYPYYMSGVNITEVDIHAVQYLYGIPDSSTKLPIMTTKKPDEPASLTIDLCSIKYPDQLLITFTHYFYIFHKKWVWLMNINDKKYRDPKLISEYLPFVKQISHIYQRPSGEVVIIDENKFYLIDFPSLISVRSGNINELGVPSNKKIQTILIHIPDALLYFTIIIIISNWMSAL